MFEIKADLKLWHHFKLEFFLIDFHLSRLALWYI